MATTNLMADQGYGSSADSAPSPTSAASSAAGDLSSSATTPTSARSQSRNGPRTDEAKAFLSDVNNYLGVGSLVFREILAEDSECLTIPRWQEVTQLPLLEAFNGSTYAHLQSLAAAGWIKVFWSPSVGDPHSQIYRVYVLPFDVGHRFVDRRSTRLASALESLIAELDVGVETWNGRYGVEGSEKFDPWATKEDGSLFWMFNKLPSPSPNPEMVSEKYAREALEDLLDPDSLLHGLKTPLYPYQRRSAGLMLQRESVSTLELDPRLEQRTAMDGTLHYYSARDAMILRHPRYYEACKGGILAESMGWGKTLMCLALIIATKKHFPKIPAAWNRPVVRPSVGSLASMAVTAINNKSVPWQVEFERIRNNSGEDMRRCRERLEKEPASYKIFEEPQRWNRTTITPPPRRMTLAATTLIVVPHNLLRQWRLEIQKHVEDDLLSALVMEDSKKPLPSPLEYVSAPECVPIREGVGFSRLPPGLILLMRLTEFIRTLTNILYRLRQYDIVLFTRKRFEQESKDGSDNQGRRMGTTQRACRCPYIGDTRVRDCTCLKTDDLYDSPLKHLHFLRIIIDEGHFFSNNSGIAATVAEKLLKVDHRWVVSGTPAKDLLGVEVDTSSAENAWRTPETKVSRDMVLEQRRHFSEHDRTGAIKSLGSLAKTFLKIRPWADDGRGDGESKADWDDYVFRHEGFRSRKIRTFSGFSAALRRTLEAMVIKTQPYDVEKDLDLPPLTHEIVRLEPSFYDKVTANLFTLVLTANAVTSERTDQDYLFHKNSAKARYQLVANLRQSAFFWTGFSEEDVLASISRSESYLKKDYTYCSDADRRLLTECREIAEAVLLSKGWRSMSRSHELGVFVDGWPSNSSDHWSFDRSRQPLLTGVSQLLAAQHHVHEQVGADDPAAGFSAAGVNSVACIKSRAKGKESQKDVLTKAGLPTSSLDGEPTLKRRMSSINKSQTPIKGSSRAFRVVKPAPRNASRTPKKKLAQQVDGVFGQICQSSPKRSAAATVEETLSPQSPFLKSRMVGTTSAKMSYLISQILRHYQNEKILVFYDGENAAYYIAQMLDLLHIKHEIYAKSLKASQKSEYAVRFDQEAQDRVLLMDVRQAAFGLNLPAASRIYFVNPVCRGDVEAQAIKRAHRIGQSRVVHVETLVLKGTIEEQMLDRSKRMTRAEHLDATHLEDDRGVKQIIQSARPLPMAESRESAHQQMAPLATPQQVWCREGWREYSRTSHKGRSKKRKSAGDVDDEKAGIIPNRRSKARRSLAYVDCSGGNVTADQFEIRADSEDDVPLRLLSHGQRSNSALQPTPPSDSLDAGAGDRQSIPIKTEAALESDPGGSTRHAVDTHTLPPSGHDPQEPGFRGLSFPTLLNEEQDRSHVDNFVSNGLMQDILGRL